MRARLALYVLVKFLATFTCEPVEKMVQGLLHCCEYIKIIVWSLFG
jgi:hypothetical protein